MERAPGAHYAEDTLRSRVKIPAAPGEVEPIYLCQNTQIKFATKPLEWWDVRQYVEDYTSGNVPLPQLAAGLLYTVWRTIAEAGVGSDLLCASSMTRSSD